MMLRTSCALEHVEGLGLYLSDMAKKSEMKGLCRDLSLCKDAMLARASLPRVQRTSARMHLARPYRARSRPPSI